jgi:hypothetical protein
MEFAVPRGENSGLELKTAEGLGVDGRRGGYRLAFVVSIKNDLEER